MRAYLICWILRHCDELRLEVYRRVAAEHGPVVAHAVDRWIESP